MKITKEAQAESCFVTLKCREFAQGDLIWYRSISWVAVKLR